jgi:ATP-dependent Lon protease
MSSYNHRYNTRIKSGAIKRKEVIYDSSSDNSFDSDSDYIEESDNESDDDVCDNEIKEINKKFIKNNGKINKLDYYKFLNKLFPSNYSKEKIKKIKRQRLYSPLKKDFKFNLNNSKYTNDSDSEDIDNNSDNNSDENNMSYDEEEYQKTKELIKDKIIDTLKSRKNKKNKEKNINIILNMNGSSSTIYNNEDKNSLGEMLTIANSNIKDKDEDEDEDEDSDDNDNENDVDDEIEYKNMVKLKNKIKNKYNKINDLLGNEKSENLIIDDNQNINLNINNKLKNDDESFSPVSKKLANKNYKEFSKILDDDDKEEEYFKKKLSKKDQLYYIIKLKQLKELTSIEKPYLIHLMNLDIPDEYKACALRKINILRSMGCGFGNSEYYKIKSWIDAFIKIPFNKYNNLPITFADGIQKCHDFMENAKNTLDKVAFGLEDAKIQIMQMIGLWLVNPNAVGSAIAIKGPPGTGKTTLIKEGISKILNRPFAMIALGGCGDSGFLDGHDYTYEGSKYGKIIDILIQSGSMNPVILFDELDKLSDSTRGQEITGVLTHLTDSTQNSRFTDKYMSEITLDMSKALYIFSYNDESLVNPILKDRMYKIETKGYKEKDKIIIAKDYLLPKIREQSKYEENDIILDDTILEYIIKEYTESESGVRNLKRCLEIIHTKLNLYRLMKPDINLFENSEGFKLKKRISFPCTITKEILDNLLIKGKKDELPFGMYN